MPAPFHAAAGPAAGYLLSHHSNDAFIAVNRLLKAGDEVYWTEVSRQHQAATRMPAGTMFVPARRGNGGRAAEAGDRYRRELRRGDRASRRWRLMKLNPVRIGLWDTYGGSMPSGWTRWLLEQYEFPFQVVYPKALDAGDLTT